MRPRRLLLSTAAAAIALSGLACGADEEVERPAAGPTALEVTVRPEGSRGPAERKRIRCPGHEVCDRVDALSADAFDPVPPETACTQVYGGPATARVEGQLRGTRIDATFSRADGCQIGRWDRLAWLLGRQPGPGMGAPASPRAPRRSG